MKESKASQESILESVSKNRRGRPANKYTSDEYAWVANQIDVSRVGNRTVRNIIAAKLVWDALLNPQSFIQWNPRISEEMAAKLADAAQTYFRKKRTLLAKISHLEDPKTIIDCAVSILQDKLKGKAALNEVSARRFPTKVGNHIKLEKMISRAVTDFVNSNPKTGWLATRIYFDAAAENISSELSKLASQERKAK